MVALNLTFVADVRLDVIVCVILRLTLLMLGVFWYAQGEFQGMHVTWYVDAGNKEHTYEMNHFQNYCFAAWKMVFKNIQLFLPDLYSIFLHVGLGGCMVVNFGGYLVRKSMSITPAPQQGGHPCQTNDYSMQITIEMYSEWFSSPPKRRIVIIKPDKWPTRGC